ncbi:PREDICTED: uncharacterized protein LOC105565817 isoform X2 [Vollenhovia emeryi]|nr:PREDICTED: uncharacterized protein LOC105565817 isoform X2 [Vollenhovia emeryi]
MWEKDRCDGKRKLKCNAVPTIFSSRSMPSDVSALLKNGNGNNNVVNMYIANLTDEGKVKINCQYQLHPDNIEQLENEPENMLAFANTREEMDWKKRCEELTQLLRKSESKCEELRESMKRREELFNKIIKKSYRCGKVLKKRLKKLREENQIYDKLKIRLYEIFNEDQIKALSNQGSSCRGWSDETIKRAIRLRRTCGSVGYQQILDQNIPLPSERTLRRKMNSIELDKDVKNEIETT